MGQKKQAAEDAQEVRGWGTQERINVEGGTEAVISEESTAEQLPHLPSTIFRLFSFVKHGES